MYFRENKLGNGGLHNHQGQLKYGMKCKRSPKIKCYRGRKLKTEGLTHSREDKWHWEKLWQTLVLGQGKVFLKIQHISIITHVKRDFLEYVSWMRIITTSLIVFLCPLAPTAAGAIFITTRSHGYSSLPGLSSMFVVN